MSKYTNNFQNEPQLIDDQAVAHVKSKVQNKSNLITDTGTNMMVEFFGNSEKLVGSDERKYYENDNDGHDDHDDQHDDNLDDDHTNYKKPSNKTASNIFEQNNYVPPHQSEKQNTSDKKHESYTDSTTSKGKEHNGEDESSWSTEELALRKLDMLRKLGELSKHCGVKLSQNYNMNSDYKTMKFEYELHSGIRSKQNAISWMSGMMILTVQGMEMMNDHLNPFDMKFDNTWSNKVRTDISDYHDVLGKIYEKYTTPGKEMAPELKLFLMLTGSAIMIQGSKIASHLLPTTSGNLDNDPNLIKSLRQKAEQEEKEEQMRKNKLNEYVQNDHKLAAQKAYDLQIINNAKSDYANMQQNMPNQKNMENFNNTLILSESAKSIKSQKQKKNDQNVSESQNNQQFIPAPSNNAFMEQQSKQKDLLVQNQKLLAMQQMLQNMRNEQRLVNTVNSAKKQQSEPIRKEPLEQKKKQQKPKEDSSSDSSSDSSDGRKDNSSNLSSMSSISVNPNLENILGKAISRNIKKAESSSEKTTESSSSKKKGIKINLDNELTRMNNIIPIKKMNRDEAEKNITYESISFGKKSNISNESGSTGKKRGRPAKNSMKIKVGV
jgi:hypothetical protein